MELSRYKQVFMSVLLVGFLVPVMCRTLEDQNTFDSSHAATTNTVLRDRKCHTCPDPDSPPHGGHHHGGSPPSHGSGGGSSSTPSHHGSPPSHDPTPTTPSITPSPPTNCGPVTPSTPSHTPTPSTPIYTPTPSTPSHTPTPSTPSYTPTPSTPSTPSYTPTPSTPSYTPTPSTPSAPISVTPPSTPIDPGTPSIPSITPITPTPPSTPIDPGTPSIPSITPTPPFLPDPNSNPFTCDYWRNHPTLIWGLVGWWGTLGNAFTLPSSPGLGSTPSALQALSNTRTDGYGALYREGTASMLNSMMTRKFPFTTSQVRDHFVSALRSDKAAAAQARVFKNANEGHLKP